MDVENWKSLGLPSSKELAKNQNLPLMPDLLNGCDTLESALSQIRTWLGVEIGGTVQIRTPIGIRTIDDKWLEHIVIKREATREKYVNLVIPTLNSPNEIWLSDYEEGKRERYLKYWRNGNKAMLVVVHIQNGDVLWNVIPMPIRSVDRQREGNLLWKKYQ